jgi:hypothetical protein
MSLNFAWTKLLRDCDHKFSRVAAVRLRFFAFPPKRQRLTLSGLLGA